jgi:hypothetical protein
MRKKTRSRFWVVSTHVLTTGFAIPFVASFVVTILLQTLQIEGWIAFLVSLALQAIGYIGGTYYSLNYIQKVALIDNPMSCVKPSVITFIVLAVLSLILNLVSLRPLSWEIILILIIFYGMISLAFAKITEKGFVAISAKRRSENS